MTTLREKTTQELGVLPTIDPKEEVHKSIDLLKACLAKHPFLETFILGISGERNSALTGRLTQLAMTEMCEETGDVSYQFIVIRLPYDEQANKANAQAMLAFIQPGVSLRVDIRSAVDAMIDSLESAGVQISDFNKGNMKARQYMITQYIVTGENAGAVIGTGHAAGNVTAFFTKYGDGGVDILSLFRLNKYQGKALPKELGASEALYLKIPTVDLEDDKPLVVDEVALSVTYGAIGDYLEGKKISETNQQTIGSQYRKGQHKRHLPVTIFDDFWK